MTSGSASPETFPELPFHYFFLFLLPPTHYAFSQWTSRWKGNEHLLRSVEEKHKKNKAGVRCVSIIGKKIEKAAGGERFVD